jgi:hypothetical protein
MLDGNILPDGTLAARCNDRDFGTSLWQLAYQSTAASIQAKAAWIVRPDLPWSFQRNGHLDQRVLCGLRASACA